MKRLAILLIVAILFSSFGAVSSVAASSGGAIESSACSGSPYTIRFGDTLAIIAARFGSTVSAILSCNTSIVNANRIFPGHLLNMPSAGSGSVTTYVVKFGDTLNAIAARFGVSVWSIMRANGIVNPNRIFPGQRLAIPEAGGTPVFTTVKVALIDIGGNAGVGCGDAVVMVDRPVAATTAPLTAAINQLLSISGQYYGQSGLYNALYQANLTVQSITISNGHADIRLTGSVNSGGVCDDPRIIAQFERTAKQFSTVQSVSVYVNGTLLQTLLSGK